MKVKKGKYTGPSPIAVTFGANKNYFSNNEDIVDCFEGNKENTIDTASSLHV